MQQKKASLRKKSLFKKRPSFDDRWRRSERDGRQNMGYEGLMNLKKRWGRTAVISQPAERNEPPNGNNPDCNNGTDAITTMGSNNRNSGVDNCSYWFGMNGQNSCASDCPQSGVLPPLCTPCNTNEECST